MPVLHTRGNMCTPRAYTLCRRVLIVCATSVLAEMGVDRTQRRERVGYARKKEKKFYFLVWEKNVKVHREVFCVRKPEYCFLCMCICPVCAYSYR